jgi:hypothetical protein
LNVADDIQRLNTSGALVPSAGCTLPTNVSNQALCLTRPTTFSIHTRKGDTDDGWLPRTAPNRKIDRQDPGQERPYREVAVSGHSVALSIRIGVQRAKLAGPQADTKLRRRGVPVERRVGMLGIQYVVLNARINAGLTS